MSHITDVDKPRVAGVDLPMFLAQNSPTCTAKVHLHIRKNATLDEDSGFSLGSNMWPEYIVKLCMDTLGKNLPKYVLSCAPLCVDDGRHNEVLKLDLSMCEALCVNEVSPRDNNLELHFTDPERTTVCLWSQNQETIASLRSHLQGVIEMVKRNDNKFFKIPQDNTTKQGQASSGVGFEGAYKRLHEE